MRGGEPRYQHEPKIGFVLRIDTKVEVPDDIMGANVGFPFVIGPVRVSPN